MLSFWSRKGNKSPAAGRTSNILSQDSQQGQDVELPRTTSRLPQFPSVPVQPQSFPADIKPEPVIAAVPNPHDAAVSEVHAKLLQAEQLSSTTHLPCPTDPLTEAVSPPIPPPLEPLFDPATGTQRGVFEPAVPSASSVGSSSGSCDNEQLRDEVWTHLARIREIQSQISVMHVHMEGIGNESGSIDVEVDNDIDVDTVPTQEEEDAAKRAKEFEKLPGRFKGRSDNIDAMMSKLDELSRAVTSFHALQPPPLSFDSAPTSRQNTHSSASPGDPNSPVTIRTRTGIPPMFGSKGVLDQPLLHDSPISPQAPFTADTSLKT